MDITTVTNVVRPNWLHSPYGREICGVLHNDCCKMLDSDSLL
jgi:hypothetical protein